MDSLGENKVTLFPVPTPPNHCISKKSKVFLPQDHHLYPSTDGKNGSEENEARLSQRGIGGSWCCELGEMGGEVTQSLEGASLRVETGSLGDFCQWQTNPMSWTEGGEGISLHPGHSDMTDP